MRKKLSLFFILTLLLSFTFVFSAAFTPYNAETDDKLYLGGMPAGFSLNTKGAEIVGLCDVVTKNGIETPSKDAGLNIGDIILSINSNEVNGAKDIERNILGKKQVEIEIKRNGDLLNKNVTLSTDMSGNNKLGVFIREDVSGIGTITFIKGNRFASLGHPVVNDSGELLDIYGGKIFNCNLTGCVKGERGKAGELRGVFLKNNPIGNIDKNLHCGVYGRLNKDFDFSNLIQIEKGVAVQGDAHIYTTIDDMGPQKYSISIVKVDNDYVNKNFVIKINDEKLLNVTGGIIQGMSGSPIIQNNKLVGAVTHVFINDPTRGFGIAIDNMINN